MVYQDQYLSFHEVVFAFLFILEAVIFSLPIGESQ